MYIPECLAIMPFQDTSIPVINMGKEHFLPVNFHSRNTIALKTCLTVHQSQFMIAFTAWTFKSIESSLYSCVLSRALGVNLSRVLEGEALLVAQKAGWRFYIQHSIFDMWRFSVVSPE